MIGCEAKFADGCTMLLGGIALIAEPIVLGIFFSQTVHIVITIGLCQNTGCSNRKILSVAFDDAGVGERRLRVEG